MEKDWKDIDILITKYLTNSISQEEQTELDQWKLQDKSHSTHFEEMEKVWANANHLQAFTKVDVYNDLEVVKSRIHFEQPAAKIRRFSIASRVAAVMIPALLFIAGFSLYQNTPGFGKWQAFSTNSTNSEIVLPDATNVTLNHDSRLVYLKNMEGNKRLVKLKGEGYFKVAKNPGKPFVIKIGKANVEVLGTEFNLEENAENGRVCINVTEGKVRFWSGQEEAILVAGDQAIFSNGRIEKKEIRSNNFLSWKTGIIRFNNANLEEICTAIQDHFEEVSSFEIPTSINIGDIQITTRFSNPSLQEVIDEIMIHSNKKIECIDGKLIISD